MRGCVEEHWSESDPLTPQRVAKLEVKIAWPEMNRDATRRNGFLADSDHVMLAVRDEVTYLGDHPRNELILASPEADDYRLGILAQQSEEQPLQTPHHDRSRR
jgi:hypothetical protein